MSSGTSPFGSLRKAVQAFFRHDVVLQRGEQGMRLAFEDRRLPQAKRPRTRAEIAASKEQQDLALARAQLAALMDQDATLRSTLRQLAFVEHALEKKGFRGLYKVPLEVLQKALQQLETLVSNWSPEGLACLRSKMAVAVLDREHHDSDDDAAGRQTAAVLEGTPTAPPAAAARAIEAARAASAGAQAPVVPPKAEAATVVEELTDEAALLAAYAALGNAAPVPPTEIEIQPELKRTKR